MKDKYIPVLDHGFVALVDYMGGDYAIERAARVSYGAGTRKLSDTRNLIRYLVSHRHTSPLEQTVMTFHISMPVFVLRQFIRHRTARLNEYSGRYSEMPTIFYTPEQEDTGTQSQSNKQGRSSDSLPDAVYADFVGKLQHGREVQSNNYKNFLENDVARELARIDLPLSTYTYLYWQIDLHNLFHLLRLRLDSHAQFEIREYARVLAGFAKEVAPLAFEAFEDYSLYAKNFSCYEMEIIQEMMRGDIALDTLVQESTLSARERIDFLKKLEKPIRQNFTLDFSQAREASFYESKIKENL